MEEVQSAVMNAAQDIYESYLAEDMTSGKYPLYKASGMAYIRFAKEERELFKLLFMRDRNGEPLEPTREVDAIIPIIMKTTGLSREQAERFHLEMWVVVHGIASMIATSYLIWNEEQISGVMTDFYTGLRTVYK